MTITALGPNTTLRPLGEEHFRMFRRTLGSETEIVPRVNIHRAVFFSEKRTNYRNVVKFASKFGDRLATVSEVAMDAGLLLKLEGRHGVFVSPKGIPEKEGTYKLDRSSLTFIPISEDQAKKLARFERVCVYDSAIKAIRSDRSPTLYVETSGGLAVHGFIEYNLRAAIFNGRC